MLSRVSLVATLVLAACGGAKKAETTTPKPLPKTVGECGEIETAGQVSARPDLRRADRDLNRDGRDELVATDKTLCRGDNCHWNLFAWDGACYRFVGTVSGAAIETGDPGEAGFPELRSWWRFSGGERALLQVYRFGGAGYRLVETLMCRQGDGDGIQCALEESL